MLDKKTASQCISSDYRRGWNDAVDAIPRWISVDEKLPEEKEDVAAIIRWNEDVTQYGIAFMLDGKWLMNGTGRVVVSHWCPLPKE